MLTLVSTIITLIIAGLGFQVVAAAPQSFSDQCDTSTIYCCDGTTSTINNVTSTFLHSIGIPVQGIDVPIGLACSAITVGLEGGGCEAEPLCCQDTHFGGFIAVGCTPISALSK